MAGPLIPILANAIRIGGPHLLRWGGGLLTTRMAAEYTKEPIGKAMYNITAAVNKNRPYSSILDQQDIENEALIKAAKAAQELEMQWGPKDLERERQIQRENLKLLKNQQIQGDLQNTLMKEQIKNAKLYEEELARTQPKINPLTQLISNYFESGAGIPGIGGNRFKSDARDVFRQALDNYIHR